METVARDDYLNKILYAVQNGQTDSLVELWANLGGIPMGDKAPFNGTLSDCRNNGIGTVFMLYQLAQQQGIGSEQLEDIKNFYVNRLSRIRSFDEFSSTIYEALLAFTQRIKDNTDFVTKNPVLNRVIRYIRSNITEKLTAEQIAADMNISVGYIFAKFRSELNTTFSRFLLEEKIKKATQLLLLTDKPLVEISNYLSFSSQSYFQKSFKKISGLTPTEYRLEQGKV